MTNSVERFQDSQWEKLDTLNFSKQAVLDLIKRGNVLDVGCGDGLLLEKLKERGLAVAGIDISAKAIALCKERGLNCSKGDITNRLPFEDSSYDSVLLIDVLEHLFQPLELLQEAHRVSRKYVVISVPNFVSLPARLQALFGNVPENNTPRDGHVYWMTWVVLRGLLKQARLEVEEVAFNTFWERIPLIGLITSGLKKINPSLFALSFIIKAKKV